MLLNFIFYIEENIDKHKECVHNFDVVLFCMLLKQGHLLILVVKKRLLYQLYRNIYEYIRRERITSFQSSGFFVFNLVLRY